MPKNSTKDSRNQLQALDLCCLADKSGLNEPGWQHTVAFFLAEAIAMDSQIQEGGGKVDFVSSTGVSARNRPRIAQED